MGAWWQGLVDELRGFVDWKPVVTGAAGWGLKVLWDRHRSKRQSAAQIEHEWRRVVLCKGCDQQVPRWFMQDRSTPRGPVEHYALPPTCRNCRSRDSWKPPYPQNGEPEAAYEASGPGLLWRVYRENVERKIAEAEAEIEAEERAELERSRKGKS